MFFSKAQQVAWEAYVDRRYDGDGHMIALNELTIEMGAELCHIPKGHKLSREEAKCYPGDVQHVFRKGETSGAGVLGMESGHE